MNGRTARLLVVATFSILAAYSCTDRRHWTLETVAGTGARGYSGDGMAATAAKLKYPTGIAVDTKGNLYIADTGNNRIRRVDAASKRISTLAGTGVQGFNGDAIDATSAELNHPVAVAVDQVGNVYIADKDNNRVRKVDAATRLISTVAGNGIRGEGRDGAIAVETSLWACSGVAVDHLGNLYVGEQWRVWFVDRSTGRISTLPGTAFSDADLSPHGVKGIALDRKERVYFSDDAARIWRVSRKGGKPQIIASTRNRRIVGNAKLPRASAWFYPYGIAVDEHYNIYATDCGYWTIRRIDARSGRIATLAGMPEYKGERCEDYSGAERRVAVALGSPIGIALDQAGGIYFSESQNNCIRLLHR